MHLELSREQIYTRGGLLDQLLENAFDASLILDRQGLVVYVSRRGSQRLGQSPMDMVGRPASHFDPNSPFFQVMETGEAQLNIFTMVAGSPILHNIIPIQWQGEVLGVLAVMAFRHFSDLKHTLSQLLDSRFDQQAREAYDLLSRRDLYTFSDFVGQSPAVKKLLWECERVAAANHPVLITGETGTGKEILAGAIHAASPRKSFQPYVKINCTAIPDNLMESELFGHEKGAFTGATAAKKGKFELAGSGSILLDEIGEMDLRLQAKLLRVLEANEFERLGGTRMLPMNARVIASTNADLPALCREKRFRSDLYYRLNTLELRIPALRERKEDIPLLVDHFIALEGHSIEVGSDAMERFQDYDWPGNVRQLRNIVNRLGIIHRGERIGPEDVTAAMGETRLDSPAGGLTEAPASIGQAEREAILRALGDNGYRIAGAAKALGISRPTLYRKLEKYGIRVERNTR